ITYSCTMVGRILGPGHSRMCLYKPGCYGGLKTNPCLCTGASPTISLDAPVSVSKAPISPGQVIQNGCCGRCVPPSQWSCASRIDEEVMNVWSTLRGVGRRDHRRRSCWLHRCEPLGTSGPPRGGV